MEKKKLHRVVGILILIAVVIIVLPLVTGRNELLGSKTLSVEAPPPFPGAGPAEEAENTASDEPPVASPSVSTPEANASASPSGVAAPATDQPPAVTPPGATPQTPEENSSAPSASEPAAPPKQDATPSSTAPTRHSGTEASLNTPTKKKVAHPVSTAWALQLGNFHNHNNAIRLANRLRTAGYKAFTRQVVSRTGVVSTRVYVGPEMAEANAKKLSGAIHEHLNLDSLVVPFEPLAL